jgi:Galactose oxidase, central domain
MRLAPRLLLVTLALSTFAPSQANWRPLKPANPPPPRTGHLAIAEFSSLFAFGGRTGSTYLADTWRFAGGKWRQLATKTSPGPLVAPCGTWDSARGIPVLFGGRKTGPAGKLSDETWEFARGNWVLVKPTTRPAARIEGAMVFAGRFRRAMMFGGVSTKLLGDTWIYRAGTWTRVRPKASPSARRGHAMAHDKQRGRTLLFGGRSTVALRDTWEWNGATWRRITTKTSPPARWGHAMTHDAGRERFVLFGGSDGTKVLDSTWEFDGTDWIERKPSKRPVARTGFQFHYLQGLDHSTGFGGADKLGAALKDTWDHFNPTPPMFSNFGAGCRGSSGIPFMVGSRPWIGESLTLTVLNALPLAPTFMNFGRSKTNWGTLALPFDMRGMGAPGCQILVDPLVIVPMQNSLGRPHLIVKIPNDVRLIGVTVFEQAWTIDIKANKLGLNVSDAGVARIGAK